MIKKASLKIVVAVTFSIAMFFGTAAVVSASTTTTTISSVISPVISLLTSNGTVSLPITPTSGGVQTIQSDTVTVSTNDSAGYTLQMNSAATTLVSGSNTIPASSGTVATPIAMAVNTWGWRVDGLTGSGFGAGPTVAATNAAISGTIKFAAMPTTATTINSSTGVASSATTPVWYADAANYSQASGTYTNTVTYTATTN